MATGTTGAKRGASGSVTEALFTFYDRRWLMAYFIRRQLSQSYRSSFLGFGWMILTPLMLVALYTLIFSEIVGLRFQTVEGDSTLNFGLYLYCGLIPFLAFSEALSQSVRSIKDNATLIQKVVFPAEILPLTTAITGFVTHTVGLGVLIAIVTVLEQRLHWTIAVLPLIMVLQLLFTLGLCYLGAVIGVYLPDVRETVRAMVRAMFFVTPIIWPVSIVPDHLRFIVTYNPLAFLVGSYRDLVLNGEVPNAASILWFALVAGALFAGGFVVFVKNKQRFADLI